MIGSQDVSGQQPDLIRPADTSSPRATLKSFIDSCNELHKRIVADRYLDRTSSEHRPLSMRVLELPSGTSVVRVKRALEIVRAALDNHEGMQETHPPRVFLRDLKEASIGIFFIYWYHPPNYWDFLAFSERINLLIMEQLEAEQIPFAAPSLTVEMSDRDVQLD